MKKPYTAPTFHLSTRAFSLLEMLFAITIFTTMGLSLYSIVEVTTKMQSTTLGTQHRKNEGLKLLDKIERELKDVVMGKYSVVDPLLVTTRKTIQTEFHCTPRNNVASKHFAGATQDGKDYNAKDKMQQLFYAKLSLKSDDPLDSGDTKTRIAQLVKQGEVTWKDSRLQEKILYMVRGSDESNNTSTANCLSLFGREEKFDNTNKLEGNIYSNTTGGTILPYRVTNYTTKTTVSTTFSPEIEDIEFIFWGNTNTAWDKHIDKNGISRNYPLREWNSTVQEGNIHGVNELPYAVKVFLTLRYHPGQWDREIQTNDPKSQSLILEKVIYFKNR